MALRRTLLHTLSGLGALVTIGAFAHWPAHAKISLAGIGIGHGAQTAESFRQFPATLHRYNASGEHFRSDMHCLSACGTKAVRIVCTTPDASLALHAGSDAQQGAPDIATTSQLPGTYMPALRNDLIANQHMEMFEVDIISGDDRMRRFGYDACR
jgi:hypothetical protein